MSISVQLEGGLGNKLFQLAFLDSLSKKFPHLKCYYNTLRYSKPSHETVDWSYFTKTFKPLLSSDIRSENPFFSYREEHHRPCRYVDYTNGLTELFEKFETAHLDFFGYFQSEKYFSDDIYEKFRVTPEAKKYLNEKYQYLDNSIFLHVRRGDGLRPDCIVFSDDYYLRALNEMSDQTQANNVYVCSDDIAWCRNQKMFINNNQFNFNFVEENEIHTLWLMSLCKYGGICANSTFSWWGGYLNENKNKLIYFPDVISYFWNVEDHIPKCFTKFEIGDLEKHRYTN